MKTNWVLINPYKDIDKAKGFVADSREDILRYLRVKHVSPFNYTRPFKIRLEFLLRNFILPTETKVYVDLTGLATTPNSISTLRLMWTKLEYFCGFGVIDSVSFINLEKDFVFDFLTMPMLAGDTYTRGLTFDVLPEYDINNCNMLMTNEIKYLDNIKEECKGKVLPYQVVPMGDMWDLFVDNGITDRG